MNVLRLRINAFRKLKFGSVLVFNVRVSRGHGPWLFRVVNKSIQYNDDLAQDMDEDALVNGFIHALMFLILRHDVRGKDFISDKQSFMLWNLASEICRTDVLRQMRILSRDESFLGPEAFDLDSNKSVEEYFYELSKNVEDVSKKLKERQEDDLILPVVGESFLESKIEERMLQLDLEKGELRFEISDSGKGKDEDEDEDSDAGPSATEIQFIQDAVVEVFCDIMKRGLGSGIVEFDQLDRYRTRPDILKRLVSVLRTFATSYRGVPMTTNRPARRQVSDVDVLHIGRGQVSKIAIIVDVSSSTGVVEVKNEIYEKLYTVLKSTSYIDVYFGDTDILEKYKRVRDPSCIKRIPRGLGTDMAAILNQLDGCGYRALILITDGLTDWPESQLKTPVFLILINKDEDIEYPNWIRRIL